MFDSQNTKESMCTCIHAVCTTPWKMAPGSVLRAKMVAEFFSIPFVERKSRSIEHIVKDESCDAVVVMKEAPVVYHKAAPDIPVFFHPSMAAQRIIRMNRNEPDRLITSSGIVNGDIVVDATLGLGADSLVIAASVGEYGQVISLESTDLLYHLFQFAKQNGAPKYTFVEPFMTRIHPYFANYEHWLTHAEDDSVDVVYFDPMFRHPKSDAPAIDPLRPFANLGEISEAAFFHAIRIARKSVVIKERPQAAVFSRFHLNPDKRRASFAYGVWKKGEGQTK